jgi:hypothetical protein
LDVQGKEERKYETVTGYLDDDDEEKEEEEEESISE